MPPERQRWKGKFVSNKTREFKLKTSELGKSNRGRCVAKTEECTKQTTEITPKYSIEGLRVVDLNHMSKQMYYVTCNDELNIKNIVGGTILGVGSYFKVECARCSKVKSIESSPLAVIPNSSKKVFEVNAKLPIGAMRAGIGHTQVDTFLSTFEIPVLSKSNYKIQERLFGPFVEDVARTSCLHAVELERALTLENLDKLKKVLPPGTPEDFLVYTNIVNGKEVTVVRLFGSFDFGWTQRANGYSYDSLNGYGALIGELSKMVLSFITFNRKCRQCEYNAKNNTFKEHDCRLNFSGSAKAMEAEGARKLVVENDIFKDANVELGVFIADNDSSSISAIQNGSSHLIIKQSDLNHTAKRVSSALYNINSKVNKDPDRELQHDTVKTLKKYFSYAVKQNVGDLEKMRTAIKNIPYHAFDKHDNCGSWCKAKEDKENYIGLQLNNSVLFEELKLLFDKLAENASKFLMAASSQANESLNNSMCSKAPKRICYSTSESCDYRFACTVVQKNYGEAYIHSILHALGLHTSTRLTERIQRSNENASKRKLREERIDVKRRRIELTQARSQLKHRKEQKEGVSYSSHMSLFDVQESSTTESSNVCDENDNLYTVPSQETSERQKSIIFETDDKAIVFFDLETGGFDMFKDDVLQISLKCGDKSYDSYITPTRPINSRSSEVHNLTRINKNLFKNGKQVETRVKSVVVHEVLQFLKSIGKKCVLVAHKCEFDSRRLVILVKSCALLSDFEEVILGFTDTLPLFRKSIVDVDNHKLSTLASCKLNISCSEAHDAIFDVQILEKLAIKFLDLKDLIAINATIVDICNYLDKKEMSKSNIDSLLPFKDDLSKGIIQRLAEANVSYNNLIDAYLNGKDCAKLLLQGKVNGSPTIIKKKAILDIILDHLQLLIEG